jgi:hypothetical protein
MRGLHSTLAMEVQLDDVPFDGRFFLALEATQVRSEVLLDRRNAEAQVVRFDPERGGWSDPTRPEVTALDAKRRSQRRMQRQDASLRLSSE